MQAPSQSALTILVLKTWVSVRPCKKQGAKKQGDCYSIFLFLNKNDPGFFHPDFGKPNFGPFLKFQTLIKYQANLIN